MSGVATGRQPIVALTADGVMLLLEATGGRLPAVVHWGPPLPELSESQAKALIEVGVQVPGPNDVDVPVRVALLPELATGWTGRPGLQGSREGAYWSTRFVVTSFQLDGAEIDGFAAGGPGAVRAVAIDEEAQLELTLEIELLPTGLLRSRATITNTAESTYTVDNITLAYPVPGEAAEILDFGGRWGRERVPQRQPFGVGTHLRENRKGRTGADSAYLLHAGTGGFSFSDGDIYAIHTAFSGNHIHYAERNFNGQRLIGGGELLMSGEIRLAQRETYSSPWIYGSYAVGLDAVAHRFHRHLRSRPRPVSAHRPVTLNVWEAVLFDHRAERLLELAERAATAGVERFVLDDGWFGARRSDRAGLGDWVVSPQAWPDGLHPLVERVRELGMEFGLWFEPEMVNLDSEVARAHPDWIMAARREWPVETRHQQVFNLSIPAAYAHVKSQILAVLAEYEITYIKWDHNRDLIESGDQQRGGRPAVHDQTLAFYRLLDEIRAERPDLEIESCSSGGARVDLAVLERTDRVWVSDCIDPLERQHMTRWTTQLIPPEYMGTHIASGHSNTTGRTHSLSFRAGTALFGHLGVEWDLTAASDLELEELAQWISFYKEHRELLLGGDLVRMDGIDEHLFVHGVVAPDRSEAIVAMALVGSLAATPGPRLRFRGLDPEATYRVRPTIVGGTPSGLLAPLWWGGDAAGQGDRSWVEQQELRRAVARNFPGGFFTGAAIERVGLTPPIVDPDQVVLFHVLRTEEPLLNS